MVFDSFSLFICVLVSAFNVISALPEGWRACAMSSPNYEECLKEQIVKAIDFFKNGYTEMRVNPLEPLMFQRMVLVQGTGPVSGTMTMTDVKFEGLSNAKVISIKNDWKKMFMKLYIPHTRISGHYFGKGKILFLPVNGDGEFSFDWENIVVTLDITITHIIKDEKKYFQVQSMSIVPSPKKVGFYLGNLFNGNKEMGDHMNKFLNENWQEVLEDLMPTLSKSIEIGIREYINNIMSQIPAKEIDVK